MRSRTLFAALLTAAALLAGSAASANAAVLGIVDISSQNLTSSMNSPLWAGGPTNALSITRVRTVAPWDIGLRPATDPTRKNFDAWIATAQAKGMEPYVTFWMGFGDIERKKCRKSGNGYDCAMPRYAQYTKAIQAFVARYPTVKAVGAWNEPNFHKKDNSGLRFYTPGGKGGAGRKGAWDGTCASSLNPQYCGPALAAGYYKILAAACGTQCRPVAGEFTSGTGSASATYVERYKNALGNERPSAVAFHPYDDVNQFQQRNDNATKTLDFYKKRLNGPMQNSEAWLSAVGAFYSHEDSKTKKRVVDGEPSQKNAMTFIMRMLANSDLADTGRIARAYIYNFQQPGSPKQDRAVVAGGKPRLAYFALCNRSTNYSAVFTSCPAVSPDTGPAPTNPAAASGSGAPAPAPAAAAPRDVCAKLGNSVACTRNAGMIVDACDRDADGHRVYARIITDKTAPNFQSELYDTNDSQDGCGNYPTDSPIRQVAVCVQTKGCSAFVKT